MSATYLSGMLLVIASAFSFHVSALRKTGNWVRRHERPAGEDEAALYEALGLALSSFFAGVD